MKKLCVVAAIFFLVSIVMTAQSLDLTAPNGGETYLMGSKIDVKWNTDASPGKVRLVLLRFDKKVGVIEKGINKQLGFYSWTAGNYSGGKHLPVRDIRSGSFFRGATRSLKIFLSNLSHWII